MVPLIPQIFLNLFSFFSATQQRCKVFLTAMVAMSPPPDGDKKGPSAQVRAGMKGDLSHVQPWQNLPSGSEFQAV
jgi:hypothetical protein